MVLSCAVGVSTGCSKMLVVMFSYDDRKGYRWQTGLSGSGLRIWGLGWGGCESAFGVSVVILGAQSVVGHTLRGFVGAKSLVGRTLGGRIVAGAATLGAGTAILAVLVVLFKNSRGRVAS